MYGYRWMDGPPKRNPQLCYCARLEREDGEKYCRLCLRERKAKAEKIAALKAQHQQDTETSLRWKVLYLRWYDKLQIPEIAEVLDISESDVKFQIDIIKQDAR